MLLKCSCERRLIAASESATVEVWKPEQWKRTRAATQALSLTQLNGMLFKCSCERRLIAASESATAELGKPEQWKRTRAATQALSLTQLNGMLIEAYVAWLP
ncbi:MAG: hypothetical protein PVS3B1_16260 [Ktedonobacteraceae bacterium]